MSVLVLRCLPTTLCKSETGLHWKGCCLAVDAEHLMLCYAVVLISMYVSVHRCAPQVGEVRVTKSRVLQHL